MPLSSKDKCDLVCVLVVFTIAVLIAVNLCYGLRVNAMWQKKEARSKLSTSNIEAGLKNQENGGLN